MSDQPRTGSGSRRIRIGVLADGCFKLVLAAVYGAFSTPLSNALDVPGWIIQATAVLVAGSGIVEIVASRHAGRRQVIMLSVHDSAWVVTAGAALLAASRGVDGSWSAWFLFQAIASVILAVLFAIRPARRGRRQPVQPQAPEGPFTMKQTSHTP
ncbi:hypothetical protein [Microbacterium sp. NPDC056234]|uniref:hypothetical protein n=1 Tax=Microbacterium sp. NPDC056234 TaxID=3345757 RepID=UPI0035DAE301